MRPVVANFLWSAAGAAVVIAVVLVMFLKKPDDQLAQKTARQAVVGQLRLALASASEAEKSAVLAVTDEESRKFADEARAATTLAGQKRAELEPMLVDAREKELLAQFSQAFEKFQRIDKELLDLAVRNTNIKATALAFGPAAEAIRQMDGRLSHLIDEGPLRIAQAAAHAQAGALRIQALLPPHIAEESDAKMDALEAEMAREDRGVVDALKRLGTSPEADTARTAWARFEELRSQILKLSRENTNVRSLAISLNEKRSVMLLCQDALAALEGAIAEEPIHRPVRPR